MTAENGRRGDHRHPVHPAASMRPRPMTAENYRITRDPESGIVLQ